MRATKAGIECKREELKALLAFTGDDLRFSVVHFRITSSGKVVASATDGKRAVEVTATNDGGEPGEWAFDRDYIESVRRVLDPHGETIAILEVNHRGANKAVIKAIDGGAKRSEIKCPAGSVSTQISMDKIRTVLRGAGESSGSWFALNALYLSDVQSVAKAAGKCPLSIFPPAEPTGPIKFEARSEDGAWCGVVMPIRVIGPGDQAVDEDDEEPPPGEPAADPNEPLRLTPAPKAKAKKSNGSSESKQKGKGRKPSSEEATAP